MDNETARPYSLRWSGTVSLVIWLTWLAVSIGLCIPLLLWHFRWAGKDFPNLYWLFVAGLVAAAFVLPPFYHRLRRAGMARYELPIVAGGLVVIFLIYEPLATVVTALLFTSAYGVGDRLAGRAGFETVSPVGRFVIASGVGLGLWICTLIVLGFGGGYRTWIFATLLVAGNAVSLKKILDLGPILRSIHFRWREQAERASSLESLAFVFAVIFLLCSAVIILTPCITYDALRFHLPLAEHYAANSGLVPLLSDTYGYNPQGFEILMTLGYSLAGQAAARMMQPPFFLLMLLSLYLVGRECGISRAASVFGCVLAASVPFIQVTAAMVKNDLPVAFFQLAGLLVFLYWLRTRRFRWILLGVFFAGVSALIKYTAIFGIFALGVLYLYAALRQTHRLRAIVACAVLFLPLGSVWMVRSWIEKGDPFFPHDLSQPIPYEKNAPEDRLTVAWKTPWTAHFHPENHYQAKTRNPMGFLLILSLPLWLLLRRRDRSTPARTCFLWALLFLVPWSYEAPVIRFAVAPIALLMFFAAARLEVWHRSANPAGRASLQAAAAFSLLFALCVVVLLEMNVHQFRYLAGKVSRTEYLREAFAPYPVLEALNSLARPGERTFSVRNCARAYVWNRNEFYCTNLERWESDGDIARSVRKTNSRFLILPNGARYNKILHLVTDSRKIRRVYRDGTYSLYRLTTHD